MRALSLVELNTLCRECAVSHLGIEFVAMDEASLTAQLCVDVRTRQPFGLLHGGISAALAETVGSAAAMCHCRDDQFPVGVELNISHLRPVKSGRVTATATPLHLGRESQVWQIEQHDEQGNLCAVSRFRVALFQQA